MYVCYRFFTETRRYDTIEAEQFDFKAARQFRVYSYFHHHLSFVTYNLDADESPLVIMHAPVDVRYDISRDAEDDNSLVYFTVVNVEDPSITIMIDDVDFTASPDLTVEKHPGVTEVILKPFLSEGVHTVRCLLENRMTHKRTILNRTFHVGSFSPNQQSLPFSITDHPQLESRFGDATFALEYPTSSRTSFIMKTNWSHWMPILNILILFIIVSFYWLARRIGNHILRKQAEESLWSKLASRSFFPTNRTLKMSLLRDFFRDWNPLARLLFPRFFLFMTDDVIVFGVFLAVACRLFLPHFYRNEQVVIRTVSPIESAVFHLPAVVPQLQPAEVDGVHGSVRVRNYLFLRFDGDSDGVSLSVRSTVECETD